MALLAFQYLYFFTILFLFFFISFVGWQGFTLSFLILLILYSTLVIVFWCFFIAFEDQKKKKEKVRGSLFYSIFFFALSIQGSVLQVPTPVAALTPFNLIGQAEYSEFLFIFLLVYVFLPVASAFIFITLIFICFNIVFLLLLKKRAEFSGPLKPIQFNTPVKSPSFSYNSLRSSFWSTAATNTSFFSLTKNLK